MLYSQRTHTCGDLRSEHIGNRVTLNGWVASQRNLGGMIFIDLRDRYGKTQVVFLPQPDEALHARAKEIRNEFVLSITGIVQHRPEGMVNASMPTGEIEVVGDVLQVLNPSLPPPFEIADEVDAFEDLRLKYRYLDLRRPTLQNNLLLRHTMYQITHRYFDAHNFVEVETPVLMKSTPEGARDYLVPSRIHPGKFYALPQSPQTYKQLLMVAGLDRYMQIVKCFRDEDLRSDRQPEFTQIDIEMSFVRQENIFELVEGLLQELFRGVLGVEMTTPFPILDHHTALIRYGSDKPDTRFEMEIVTITDVVRESGFKVFNDIAAADGVIAGLNVKGQAGFSRSQLDVLTERAKSLGAGGLVWMKVKGDTLESPIAKFLTPELLLAIRQSFDAADGDLLLLVSGTNAKTVYQILGTLRVELGKQLQLHTANAHSLLWVVDFPLVQWDNEDGRFVAEHHPFTSPKDEDIPMLETDPLRVRANCYDLVWNGNEVASGSIRIHSSDLQAKVFSLLGLSDEEAQEKFGFLMNAFKYGAPPHGGIALGFDRMVALFTGTSSIRDVIAFPKTNSAYSLMDDSPSRVSNRQRKELHLEVPRATQQPEDPE